MKFEKLKRLYEFMNEFNCEAILEMQNVLVPCKFKQYENIDEQIALLEKGELDLILFEPGFVAASAHIQMDATGSVYMNTKWNNKIIIAKDMDEFFSKFKISFQYLPRVEDLLRKKRYITLYLDEKYSHYDVAKLIEQAAAEATSRIKVKVAVEQNGDQWDTYIEISNDEKTERLEFDLRSRSLTDYFEKELDPCMSDQFNCNFKFAVVHENVWDNRAKVVLVNFKEYEDLKAAHLIMEEVSVSVN